MIHATGRRNLAGILPPFRDQRGDSARQIRGGTGRPSQDDTVTRRGSAERGDPCLYIIIRRSLQLPGLGDTGLARKQDHVPADEPRPDNRLPGLAVTRRGRDGHRCKTTRLDPVPRGGPDRNRRTVVKMRCRPPEIGENPVDPDALNASRQIRRMVEMVPGLADPVAVIEQSALLARSRLEKNTPYTAARPSRSPLP